MSGEPEVFLGGKRIEGVTRVESEATRVRQVEGGRVVTTDTSRGTTYSEFWPDPGLDAQTAECDWLLAEHERTGR